MVVYIAIISFTVLSLINQLWNRKISNILIFAAIIFGILYNAFNSSMIGIVYTVIGMLMAFIPYSFMYIKNWITEHDLKLMVALGVLLKPMLLLRTYIFIVLISLILYIIFLILKKLMIYKPLMPLKLLIHKKSPKHTDPNWKNYPFGIGASIATLVSIGTDLLF